MLMQKTAASKSHQQAMISQKQVQWNPVKTFWKKTANEAY
jgi:hypothetical protein